MYKEHGTCPGHDSSEPVRLELTCEHARIASGGSPGLPALRVDEMNAADDKITQPLLLVFLAFEGGMHQQT